MRFFRQKQTIARLAVFLWICGALPFGGHSVSETDKGRARFQADFDLLWEELTESYPYLPYLREQGTDTDSIYERYSAELASVDREA